MAISKRLRFEILKRDGFACRYCHRDKVIITVDHVIPRTLGGTDHPSNLVASCDDCNAGKTSALPGGPTVEDVNEDLMRWAVALKRAARGDWEARETEAVINAAVHVWQSHWMPEHQADPPAKLKAEFRAQAAEIYPELIAPEDLMRAAERVASWETPDLSHWYDVEHGDDYWSWAAVDALEHWKKAWLKAAGVEPSQETVDRAELNIRAAFVAGYAADLDASAYCAGHDLTAEIAKYYQTAPHALDGLIADAAWDAEHGYVGGGE